MRKPLILFLHSPICFAIFSITFRLTSWVDSAIDVATIVYMRSIFIITFVPYLLWNKPRFKHGGFYVIIYTSIPVWCLGMVLLCVLQVFGPWMWFNSPQTPPSHHAYGGKEDPQNFKTEVIISTLWWKWRSVESLKLLVSLSPLSLWPRMLELMLKRGYSTAEKRKHWSHFILIFLIFFISIRILSLYF